MYLSRDDQIASLSKLHKVGIEMGIVDTPGGGRLFSGEMNHESVGICKASLSEM